MFLFSLHVWLFKAWILQLHLSHAEVFLPCPPLPPPPPYTHSRYTDFCAEYEEAGKQLPMLVQVRGTQDDCQPVPALLHAYPVLKVAAALIHCATGFQFWYTM
jgi:hypothetical protein